MSTLSFEQFISHILPPITLYDLINKYSTDQIDENSTDRAVRTATRQALLSLHSDKTKADYDKDEYLKVSEAKDLLCNESERERYNVDVDAAKANHRDKIEEARVLYEEEIKKEKERMERLQLEEEDEKHKLWKQERERKKDERKTKRSPGGNSKKKNTRDVEAKKAAEAKAEKERCDSIAKKCAKKVAKAKAEMAAEEEAAKMAAEMAVAEESAAADDVQAMDIDGVSTDMVTVRFFSTSGSITCHLPRNSQLAEICKGYADNVGVDLNELRFHWQGIGEIEKSSETTLSEFGINEDQSVRVYNNRKAVSSTNKAVFITGASLAPDVIKQTNRVISLGGVPSHPAGLSNQGRTCYANVNLQCAFHSAPIRKKLLSAVLPDEQTLTTLISRRDYPKSLGAALNHLGQPKVLSAGNIARGLIELQILFIQMKENFGKAIDTRNFIKTLGIDPDVTDCPLDFWTRLFSFYYECLELDQHKGSMEAYVREIVPEHISSQPRESLSQKPLVEITIPISHIGTTDVLTEIKNLYTTPTVLSGDNGWQPPMQNEVVDAAKGQSLLSNNMPGILMVSLNRFAHSGVSTHVGTKLCNRAEFPIKLDLQGICKVEAGSNQVAPVYRLQQVIMHRGSSLNDESAHYYSYVFNFSEGRWYKLDDSVVLEVEESDVLNDAFEGSSSAFMLQYVSTEELVSGDWHESISTVAVAASILPALPSNSSPPGDDVPRPDLPSAATATSPSNSVEDEVMEDEGLSESYDQLNSVDGGEDGDKDEDEEIADHSLQAFIANDKSSGGDGGSNESSDGDDELVDLDEFGIDLEGEGDTIKHPPRTFMPQELSSEVAALLEKERRAFVVPTNLDEKIQKYCFEKIGLPRTTSLPGTIKSLFDMNNENDMVLMSQVLYIHVLDEENFTDELKYQERANHIHQLMSAVTLARLGPDYKDCIHYGTKISSLDEFMTIMRYPTLNDRGKLHCWNRKNGCTLLHELIMPLWLSAEKARRDGTYEKGMKYFKRLESAGLDLATVNLRKGSEAELETEQEEIADHLGFINIEQWWSLSFGFASLHINNTVKHHNKPALVNMASKHTMLAWAGVRGDFSGTYANFYDTVHGQVPLNATQLYWKKETRDRLAASLVGFWRRHLALSDSYISEVANEFGRNGRSDADIAILRNIRLRYLKNARSVRAENIEVFNRVMPELISVCETDPVDSAARDLAVTNAAKAFRAGSSGTKRTKKVQSRMLGKLAYQYKLDFDGVVVSLLRNELRITPVMPQSSNQYKSRTSEGDVVKEILQFHLGDLLVLETTKYTNVHNPNKTWDAFERFVKTPHPSDPTHTIGDLLGLNNVTEVGLYQQITKRAGLKLNTSGTGPHQLAHQPFHLLTVTVSKPGKYLVDKLGFNDGALQVWVDQYEAWKSNRSDSVLGLYAEPVSLGMEIDELKRHLGKIADHWNRSGSKAYITAQKVHLMEMINPLKNALREYIISTSGGNVYRKPTLDQAADVLSDALSRDTSLPFSGLMSIAAGVGTGARSLPQVITGEMNRNDKQKLQVNINSAGKPFQVVISPKSSHELANMEILATCIVLNKTVGFDKIEDKTIKQDAIIRILENFRKAKLAAALSDVCPRLPSTSNILPFNTFPEGVWRKIVDMGLVVVKEKKKAKSSEKSTKKRKTATKSSKKRKAEIEPTTKRRSNRRHGS